MKNRCIINHTVLWVFAVLLLLTAACSREKNENENEGPVIPETGITMTTHAPNVFLRIVAENDTITINWGDGTESKRFMPLSDQFEFTHSYSETRAHKITITGNISNLSCLNNQLTSLDVSHNKVLTSLNCGVNQLTKLDMSSNTELQALSCYENQLTSLDVSGAAELEWLDCSGNQLAELDMSSNTELKVLFCSQNQLTASALNNLFGTLRSFDSYARNRNMNYQRWIVIHDNPGTNDCEIDIAEEKGWVVRFSY